MSTTAAQTKPKKTAAAKKPSSHPTFAEMITEAITSLKERTGSSQYAITKFIEEKHKDLPATYRKLVLAHLKKSVASGKLVKVKGSFKIAPAAAKTAPAKTTAATKAPKAVAAKAAVKPKAKAAAKPKAKTAVKPKAVGKPKSVKATPVKKAVAKKVVKKAKSVKSPAKKVKSVKSPAKKVKSVKTPVKKAKK